MITAARDENEPVIAALKLLIEKAEWIGEKCGTDLAETYHKPQQK